MKSFIILALLFSFIYCETKGIDVSSWQGRIDWSSVATSYSFAILRAGWGRNNIDSYWELNYKGAKEADIKVGAYWYSYAGSVSDAKVEAYAFINALKGKQFEYPVYYDIEEPSIFSSGLANDIARAFCTILEANKYYCGIYASQFSFKNYFSYTVKSRYSIWVAEYEVASPSFSGHYGIWQYSRNELVSGINGNVDQNIAYDDFEKIIKNAGLNGFPASGSIPSIEYRFYIIKPGDYLKAIAQKLKVSIDYLSVLNEIANPNFLRIGQILKY